MTDVKLGILLWSQAATWPEMLDAAKRVDRLGYAHLWTWDHLYAIFGDPYQPIFEGWSLLNAWARETEQTRLGLLVGANTFRNPGLVAKTGRDARPRQRRPGDPRHRRGVDGARAPRPTASTSGSGFGQRLDWLDESVGAMRRVLDGESVTSAPGGRYAFDDLRHSPLPVQARLPIMIGGSGEKKTLRTVARYADMWNAMGPIDVMAPQDRGPAAATATPSGATSAEIEFTLGIKVTIRDTEAEAERVWKAAMEHNRTPMADVEDDDTFWNGTPEQLADRLAAVRRARLPDGHLRAAGAVRRRDARALHRRGHAAGRGLAPNRASRARSPQPATAARIERASSRVGSRGELRIAASSMASWAIGSSAASSRPSARSVGRWSTSRRSLSIAPIATPAAVASGSAADATPSAIADQRQLAIARAEVEAEDLREDGRERGAVGDLAAASRSRARARGRARRPCRSPGRRRRGATPAASASAPRGPSRRRRRGGSHVPTVRIDAERHRLGERVRVGRQERLERVGHRVDPGRGGDRRRQPDGQRRVEDRRDRQQRRDGRRSPCARSPRR